MARWVPALVALLLAGCQSAQPGKGAIVLGPRTIEKLVFYLTSLPAGRFYVRTDGSDAGFASCLYDDPSRCGGTIDGQARESCERKGGPCALLAADAKIVWEGEVLYERRRADGSRHQVPVAPASGGNAPGKLKFRWGLSWEGRPEIVNAEIRLASAFSDPGFWFYWPHIAGFCSGSIDDAASGHAWRFVCDDGTRARGFAKTIKDGTWLHATGTGSDRRGVEFVLADIYPRPRRAP